MRTTVRFNESLLQELKQLAVREGRTLTAVLEESAREHLARKRRPHAPPRVSLPTFAGNGLQPGVDLDNTAALLDLMDGFDDLDRR